MEEEECHLSQLDSKPPNITIMRQMEAGKDTISQICIVPFFDGKKRIVCCSWDTAISIFNEEGECEEVQKHCKLYDILFVERTSQLVTSDYHGCLAFWNLDRTPSSVSSGKKRIQFLKETKVAESFLWKIEHLSPFCFVSCVSFGPSVGVYRIIFDSFDQLNVEIESCDLLFSPQKKGEGVFCIRQLQTESDCLVFGGGGYSKDYSLKKLNWKEKKSQKIEEFPKVHSKSVRCLSTFMKNEAEELIVSGGFDNLLLFWSVEGKLMKEVKLDARPFCMLLLVDDREGKSLLVGHFNGEILFYDLKNEKIAGKKKKIHKHAIDSLKWFDEDQTIFVSCSHDKTLCMGKISL